MATAVSGTGPRVTRDVVVAMAREDMQGFKRYVKQGREGAGMLFPGIRIRVDQDEESEVERRGSENTAMRWRKGTSHDDVLARSGVKAFSWQDQRQQSGGGGVTRDWLLDLAPEPPRPPVLLSVRGAVRGTRSRSRDRCADANRQGLQGRGGGGGCGQGGRRRGHKHQRLGRAPQEDGAMGHRGRGGVDGDGNLEARRRLGCEGCYADVFRRGCVRPSFVSTSSSSSSSSF
ncbi:hypothetical protein EYF80_008170 [Liparis tanakae]|uniref:Uncharacterized protein n=1 Tax=Liparis tanakae TaxID=230148 RepID=A0A4Z2IVY9_9TELE|nr:hypothetical protein EYF80_008170 [Liparis tanakae]